LVLILFGKKKLTVVGLDVSGLIGLAKQRRKTMPKFKDVNDNLEQHNIGGTHFGFSAAKIGDLGASEYTLVTIVVDVSGSVDPFRKEMEAALKTVVQSCRRSPRADNLMLRIVLFDNQVQELHGFKPLPDCNEGDYVGCLPSGGMTALFDATYSATKAMTQYGADLTKNDFQVNAALFIITDGMDNVSKVSAPMVAEAIQEARTSEALESIMPVLIGVNTDASTGLNQWLDNFKAQAGFQQYVTIAGATEKELAKLGGFISKSISSQSQALGSNGPSRSLSF
jgi:hypothetical protein